ncbi:MAG: hypothetical protein MJ252_19530 [archaeon]|nr:hypothetical protein [archaeon]
MTDEDIDYKYKKVHRVVPVTRSRLANPLRYNPMTGRMESTMETQYYTEYEDDYETVIDIEAMEKALKENIPKTEKEKEKAKKTEQFIDNYYKQLAIYNAKKAEQEEQIKNEIEKHHQIGRKISWIIFGLLMILGVGAFFHELFNGKSYFLFIFHFIQMGANIYVQIKGFYRELKNGYKQIVIPNIVLFFVSLLDFLCCNSILIMSEFAFGLTYTLSYAMLLLAYIILCFYMLCSMTEEDMCPSK